MANLTHNNQPIKVVQSLDEAAWRQFVAEHPDGNIFHTPEMYQVFSKTKSCQPEVWAALDERKEILALLLPVHITLNNGLLRSIATRSIVFGGVLAEHSQRGNEALSSLLDAYKKASVRKSVFTEVRNVFPGNEIQPVLNRAAFKYEDHLNYLVHLEENSDEVFNRIGHRTQKNLRRGLKKALVEIREVQDIEELEDGYSLLKRTYLHARVPLADQSLFQAAFEVLAPRGMFMAALAAVQGVPAAVSYELLYKDVITGWYGGMDRTFTAYVPNELLMWHILRNGCEKGYRVYDFGGAGKPDEKYGVRDFKAKFGGELVCYGRNTWVPKPVLLNISKLGYSIYRNLLSLNNRQNGTKNEEPESINR